MRKYPPKISANACPGRRRPGWKFSMFAVSIQRPVRRCAELATDYMMQGRYTEVAPLLEKMEDWPLAQGLFEEIQQSEQTAQKEKGGLASGFDLCVTKPFDPEELCRVIATMLQTTT